jgi:hypothetical protein
VEGLPPGSPAAVRMGLYREAAYWAIVATTSAEGAPPADLAAAWAAVDPEHLRRAAHDDITLESLQRMLVGRSAPDPIEIAAEDAARARDFVQALLADLDAPRRRIDRTLFQRWWRVSLVALVVVIAALGVRKLVLGPNMLSDKPFRLSSSWSGCAADSGCQALLFHTEHETNPWVEFDLGAPKTFHRLDVTNRSDCCGERAVPMIAEISSDRVTWKELGRKDSEFSTWTLKFPPKTARYLKLRVTRFSAFHLKDVALR